MLLLLLIISLLLSDSAHVISLNAKQWTLLGLLSYYLCKNIKF